METDLLQFEVIDLTEITEILEDEEIFVIEKEKNHRKRGNNCGCGLRILGFCGNGRYR
jgi:hypothetical protein